jgi:hypothetical protein
MIVAHGSVDSSLFLIDIALVELEMDHLILIGASGDREVPYFSAEPYDRGNFEGYLERKGWLQSDVSDPCTSDHSSEELHALLQNWLYFGVLYEFFGEELRESDFIDVQTHSVHTRNLRRYVAELDQRLSTFGQIKGQEYESRVIQCLQHVSFELREIAFQTPRMINSRLLLSIVLLCDFLRRISGFAGAVFSAGYGLMQEVSSSMFRAGWCPSTIKKLYSRIDPASFYLASRLSVPPVRDGMSHIKCIGRQCLVSQTDESAYRTDHVCPQQVCSFEAASHEKLFGILKSGNVPITTYEQGVNGKRCLEVTASRPGWKYVAISHVWSDKMGNPYGNAIPRC